MTGAAHTPYHAVLVGCGKMGGAMLRAWLSLDDSLVHHIDVIDPAPLSDTLADDARVHHMMDYTRGESVPDILILAVKPQILKDATSTIAQNLDDKTLVLSIAAGQSLATLEEIFGQTRPVIRTMPNTPAAIGEGISVSIANAHVTAEHKTMAERFLGAVGQNQWVDDEALMDAVTALSGSGPAYIFYLIEALANAGETIGLEADMAMMLARQTVIGSAALAAHEEQTSPAILRQNVTSPGGTTQAALDILMDGRFQDILNETLLAAQARSKELNR